MNTQSIRTESHLADRLYIADSLVRVVGSHCTTDKLEVVYRHRTVNIDETRGDRLRSMRSQTDTYLSGMCDGTSVVEIAEA